MIDDTNRHLLDKPSLGRDRCVVCGRRANNHHHVIQKGMGGTVYAKRIPTLLLCGMGGASGCHGLAHSKRLHFDYRDGQWWYCYLMRDEPHSRDYALKKGKWRRCKEDWETDF